MFGVRKAVSEFVDALHEVQRETERLKAENAKLKRAAERDADVLESLNLSLEESQTENAKLRELVKAAWGCVKRQVSCDECRMVCWGCTLQSAMRELGIEVEE